MELTQTSKLGDNIQSYITNQVRTGVARALKADTLSKFMDEFNQKLVSAAPASSVTDAMVPIYASAFSTEDIQGLIQFYESPLGQRVVKNLPAVDQQSQAAGVRIEQAAALAILRGMSEEYPELKQILPPEPGQPAPAVRRHRSDEVALACADCHMRFRVQNLGRLGARRTCQSRKQ